MGVSWERNGQQPVSNGERTTRPRNQDSARVPIHGEMRSVHPWVRGSDPDALQELRDEGQQMNCDDVRPELLHYQRGQLSTRHRNDIRVHLQGCPGCAHEVAADALLTETLERRLP